MHVIKQILWIIIFMFLFFGNDMCVVCIMILNTLYNKENETSDNIQNTASNNKIRKSEKFRDLFRVIVYIPFFIIIAVIFRCYKNYFACRLFLVLTDREPENLTISWVATDSIEFDMPHGNRLQHDRPSNVENDENAENND
nr:PREDICTED: uncharacterized protein LOC105670205 isoform X2 [Linepithema humile]